MKLITYALFNAKKERFEKLSYIRGFYFNVRMNQLIYPDWRTHLEIDKATYDEFQELFTWFIEQKLIRINVHFETPPLCEGMLWRMRPLFTPEVTHVLCRDTDAITTYREAQAVNEWIESGKDVHAILDNPAHGGLMGGMIGFKAEAVRNKFSSWNHLISGTDLSQHGSDQKLINGKIHPVLGANSVLWHNKPTYPKHNLPNVSPKLWESDLTCRHIGSAGVVEMETLRFFKRFDNDSKWNEIERKYPQLFYWHA